MRTDKMYLHELQSEIEKQAQRLNSTLANIEKIHGTHDYSDEVAKHFHLGMVGFRKDTKRQERTINKAVNNATKACEQYKIRDEAQASIDVCQKTISFIQKKSPDGEAENYTKRMILDQIEQAALSSVSVLKWEKAKGQYSTVYKFRNYEVERVDAGFAAIRKNLEFVTHCKTVKEAKAMVSLFVQRESA